MCASDRAPQGDLFPVARAKDLGCTARPRSPQGRPRYCFCENVRVALNSRALLPSILRQGSERKEQQNHPTQACKRLLREKRPAPRLGRALERLLKHLKALDGLPGGQNQRARLLRQGRGSLTPGHPSQVTSHRDFSLKAVGRCLHQLQVILEATKIPLMSGALWWHGATRAHRSHRPGVEARLSLHLLTDVVEARIHPRAGPTTHWNGLLLAQNGFAQA